MVTLKPLNCIYVFCRVICITSNGYTNYGPFPEDLLVYEKAAKNWEHIISVSLPVSYFCHLLFAFSIACHPNSIMATCTLSFLITIECHHCTTRLCYLYTCVCMCINGNVLKLLIII